ncbi:hypothetical protein M378DRAFT_158100 [Amanita muscaria Koide BX008]|uniref:Letm1 RBD domain-containing protein n=1 Tax=Amanita muscaria (strain Koide BX008) TaxID=946122 RepID=A0A0C2TP18_AMAMK|nr:hypothetical protein M378DRAFT_158100 [Amanita muscaria Koide BX008]
MLRSLSRNVAVHRSTYLVWHPDQRVTFRFISGFSEPSEDSASASKTSLSQPAVPRKIKLDLRPGPVKPKSASLPVTFAPTQSRDPQPLPSSSPSFGTAKVVSKRDIEEAQAHGILTPPPPNANWFRKTLHKGIQLAKFYYRGVKLIFIRRKEISAIRARIRAGGIPMTRSEFRLIATQKSDVRKVIPFIVIALLLEEIIPLIAIYLPSMLPSTCILPSQRARIEEKKTEKSIAYSTMYRPLLTQLRALENPPGHLSFHALQQPQAPEAICGILRLSTMGIDMLRIRRIRRHLAYIIEDDQLLLRHQLPLSERDLDEALEERGMFTQGFTPTAKQGLLQWWLESVRDVEADAAFGRRLSLVTEKQLEQHLV